MAELDFSHRVSEIPEGEIQRPLQRNAAVAVTPFPDMQSAITQYADATNWMSAVGSAVASRASNAIAEKIGGELGQNPKGNLGLPLTDFDKVMQQSYETQAHASLGLQADKLITDANLETAKANRITPELIAATNKNISVGLQNIFKNSPSSILPSLQSQYGNLQINQMANLNKRMIQEQNRDRQNNTALAAQMNSEHAYSFGLSGNDKAALNAVEITKKLTDADVASNLMSPQDAKNKVDAARQSYLSGKMIHEYENASAQGKGEEYLKSIVDKKPNYLSDKDYMSVTNNLMSYVSHQKSLRSQDESLSVTKFQTSVALNPMAPDMPAQLQQLKSSVSADTFEKAQLYYINAVKTFNREQGSLNEAVASWTNPSSFARLNEKAINKGFDALTARYIQQQQDQNNSVSVEEAQVQIAASAAGSVPVFVDTLKTQLNGGNPQQMDSAARQIDALYSSNNASHALKGLTDNDKALFSQYKSLRDALPPEEAAKIAIQNANQDADTQKMNKERWASFVKQQTGGLLGGIQPQEWALKQTGLNKDDFMNPGMAHEYGNMILQKYAAFYQMTNGDAATALKITKQEVNDNYGLTGVNGKQFKTLHPIEKLLGYDENSNVVPIIHQDVIQKLNQSFMPLKEAFAKNQSGFYWDVVPIDMKNHALLYGGNYAPAQVKRYIKTANGIKADTYNVVLIGNSFNWDISLQTDSGIVPLSQVAPYLGVATYTPNKNKIDADYKKYYGAK